MGRKKRRDGVDGKVSRSGPLGAIRTLYSRVGHRFERHAARLKAYGLPNADAIVEAAAGVVANAQTVVELIDKVPATWKPARGTVGGVVVEEGANVCLKKSAAQKYVGLLETGQTLHVERITGARLVCSTKVEGQSVMVIISRGHVVKCPDVK